MFPIRSTTVNPYLISPYYDRPYVVDAIFDIEKKRHVDEKRLQIEQKRLAVEEKRLALEARKVNLLERCLRKLQGDEGTQQDDESAELNSFVQHLQEL